MWKRLFFLMVVALALLPIQAAHAQETLKVAAPPSRRYALDIPADWVATPESLLPGLYMVFCDSMTITSSQSVLNNFKLRNVREFDELFDTSKPVEGALILTLAIPSVIAEANRRTPDEFMDQIARQFTQMGTAAAGDEGSVEIYEPDVPGMVRAVGMRAEDRNIGHMRFVLVLSANNTVVMLIALSDEVHIDQVDTALDTLRMQSYDLADLHSVDALDTPLDILPGRLTVDIDARWYVLDMDAVLLEPLDVPVGKLVAPNFASFKLPQRGQKGGFDISESIAIMAMSGPAENDNLYMRLYDDDGNLLVTPESTTEDFLTLLEMGEETAFQVIDIRLFRSDYEVEGLYLVAEIGRPPFGQDSFFSEGVIVYFFMIPAEDDLLLVMAMSPSGSVDQYRELIEAVFASARLVMEP